MKVKMKSVIYALLVCVLLTLAFAGCGTQETAQKEIDKGNQKMVEILKVQNTDSENLPKVITVRGQRENKDDHYAVDDVYTIDTVKHEYFSTTEEGDKNLREEAYIFVDGEGDEYRLIFATQTYDKAAESYIDKEYQVLYTGSEEDAILFWELDSVCDLDSYIHSSAEQIYVQMAAYPDEFSFAYPDEDTFTVTQTSKDKNGGNETSTYTYRNALCVGKTGDYSDFSYSTVFTWNESPEYTLPVIDNTWEKVLSDREEENLKDGRKALADILNNIDMMNIDLPLKLTVEETENYTSGSCTITSLYDAENYTYVRENKSTDQDQVIRSYIYIAPYEKQYAVIWADETVTLSTGAPVSRSYEVEFIGSKYQAITYWVNVHSNCTVRSTMDDEVRFLLIDVEINPTEYRFEFNDDGTMDVINEWTNDAGDYYCYKMTFEGNFIKSSEYTYRTENSESASTTVFTWDQILTDYTLPALDETWEQEAVEVTMAQFREANQLDALLENHENVSYSLTGVMEGSFSMEAFSTKELFYGNYNGSEQILTKDWGCIREDGVLSPAISLESEQKIIRDNLQGQLLNVGVTTEEVTGQFTKNGVRTLYTGMSEADSKYLFESLVSGATFPEGGSIKMRYEADRETLHLISATMYLVDGNYESEEIFHVDNIKYDVEAPAAVAECRDEYFRIQNASEGVRTLTLITDPGTENERTIQVKALLGTWVSITPYAENPKLYLDAACTQIFEGDTDPMKDATLYAKSEK